ncbi:uncharacterized protein Z520_03546 [Fonsecaea multimorphosa CBS 102226]|uniref:Uncharacterized protein n=1 Tax=Fonsecaea multimorphosa CBS 102226 TaxID=1442371 RepID=A0A0D2KCK3_9EURO|nr:uncharacterized protein Z520_03546 [Fonsecaea multimorphosa CBS 102226]KIY00880.1 hypothetical protein Z520_03546 [Fonsecaea multimorphosa CBS 102226]
MENEQGITMDKSPTGSPASDTQTPKTLLLSTEAEMDVQTQADKETSKTPESPASPTDQDKTSTAFFVEPDPETVHPDVDLTDRNNLVRLLALYQSGWEKGRGRGPRDHETCIWCRGPVAPNVEVLTHVGTSNSCRNSWPATCLLDWINQELGGGARNHVLRCPMCREEFFSLYKAEGADFRADQGGPDAGRVINAGWLRCILFSPVYARETCVKKGKPLIIIKSEEARKLVLLNTEKIIFNTCEELPLTGLGPRKRWIDRVLAADTSNNSGPLSSSHTFVQDPVAASIVNHPLVRFEEPPKRTFDTVWVVLDWGSNQFRMSPLLSLQADALKILMEEQGGVVKIMNADEFDAMAKGNGGLAAAVTGFQPDDRAELAEMWESGSVWLSKLLNESSKDGEHASDKEWYERLARAFGSKVNLSPEEADDGVREDVPSSAHDADDEWDSDMSLPEPPLS